MSEAAETLAHHRGQLESGVSWAAAMLSTAQREAFVLTHVRHVRGPVWFVRLMPPRHIQEGFGLAPEILVVVVRGEVQARDVQEAHAEVVRSGLRLDGNLSIVADMESSSLDQRLERIGGHGHRVAWKRQEDGSWPLLTTVLRASLPTFDAFEERDAVRGPQLVGRDAEVSDLRTRVVRGDAVALFGLRKMGKTSVMRAVTDWFDPASGLRDASSRVEAPAAGVAVVIDASLIVDRTVDAVADELLAALRRRMRAADEAMPPVQATGLRGWKSAGEALLDRDLRLCVVIDEFDLLFEGEGGERSIPGIGRLFRLLRGWAQTRQGFLSLVLVGRDPTYLQTPEIDGVTSPLIAWCMPLWLKPLPAMKARELLHKLGRRVGLDVGPRSINVALQWTGGHPLLHRQFGSALREATRRHDIAWGAPTDPWIEQAVARFQERDAVLAVMREVYALLHSRYPQALSLLVRWVQAARDERTTSHEGSLGGAARVLKNFGIVDENDGVPLGLAWYLNTLAPPLDLRPTG